CNTNRCPAGVATTNPQLARGLHVPTKELRVSRFHSETVHAFVELLGAMGYERPEQIKRKDVFRRMGNGMVKTFDDIFPCVDKGLYLDSSHWDNLSPDLLRALMSSSPDSFDPELGLDRDQTNYIHKSVGV
ncbi:MAG: hypothetical protein KDD50_06145, partial [Bdellovibrionales bacterium]|nr:hypothetical protein [Bdellovibrionales bacterium]